MNNKQLFSMAVLLSGLLLAAAFSGCAGRAEAQTVTQNPAAGPEEPIVPGQTGPAKVYFTADISPAGLRAVYNALGQGPESASVASGKVAVKISTGESPNSNHLRPALIQDLVYAAPDGKSLIQRMESRNGLRTINHGAEIGLGSKTYELVRL